MYLYIILIFFILWCLHSIISKNNSTKIANILTLVVISIVCVFAMGLRDSSVGVDTHEYKRIFEEYLMYDWNKILESDYSEDHVELGFRIFMKFCSTIFSSYYFFQLIFSITYIYLILNFINRYTIHQIMACAIFLGGGLYMQTFNIARQMLAVAIVCYAFISLLNHKIIKSILLILFSTLFHSTSIISFIAVLIYPLRNYRWLMVFTPLFLISSIIISSEIMPFFDLITGGKYERYTLAEFSRTTAGTLTKAIWIINGLVSLWVFYSPTIRNNSNRYVALLAMINVACNFVGQEFNYADRMGLYFLPCVLLTYDYLGSSIKNNIIRYTYLGCVTGCYLLYFYMWTTLNPAVKYETILE